MTYRVSKGSVSQEFVLNAIADWPEVGSISQRASGTVTSIDVASGAEVANGTTLYTADARPVVALAGDVPAFREIGLGARGPDVIQLTRGLVALKRLRKETQIFDAGVESAVRGWQKQLGIEPTGVVADGDVLFIPSLPRRISWAKEMALGSQLEKGLKAFSLLDSVPSFRLRVSSQQRQRIPDGTHAFVHHSGGTWEGVVTGINQKQDANDPASGGEGAGQVELLLGSASGPLCDDSCGEVPSDGKGSRTFLTTLVLVPKTDGLTVPIAALRTDAKGEYFVEDVNARRLPVKVVREAKGMAVIEGVPAGTNVRLADE